MALLVSGCNGADSAPREPFVGDPLSVDYAPFPELGAVRAETERALVESEERATSACMAERGFTYTPVPYEALVSGRGDDGGVLADSSILSGNVAKASEEGYNFAFVEEASAMEQLPDDTEGLSPSQVEAYNIALMGEVFGPEDFGDPTVVEVKTESGTTYFRAGSCVDVARAAVYGDSTEYLTLIQNIEDMNNQLLERVFSDTRTKEAQTFVASCMQESGYPDFVRDDLLRDLGSRYESGDLALSEAQEEERKAAVAEATCARDTGAAELFAAAYVESENAVEAENEATVTRFLEMLTEASEQVE
ncbi:MAG: hypothetical protein ACK5LS_07525 [Propioniciclava sp.]